MAQEPNEQGATIHEFPDVEANGALTERQRRILEHIRDSVASRGYPPSMREIGEAVGLTSTSSVKHQLSALESKGMLRRDPHRPRAIEVVLPEEVESTPQTTAAVYAVADEGAGASVSVPLVGRIAAGGPILADQAVEDVFALPRQLTGEGELFMLKVSGDSMVCPPMRTPPHSRIFSFPPASISLSASPGRLTLSKPTMFSAVFTSAPMAKTSERALAAAILP